ncbi:hypothetical protein VTL71DRAFT_3844 [Oculimacula yallundae]|uniref:Uncharacterized protein n=1 Tax=Oculimacula yallundae TaxID=86028 RepID=A0ABR4C451_9HELO
MLEFEGQPNLGLA